jgi:hypothetical protein
MKLLHYLVLLVALLGLGACDTNPPKQEEKKAPAKADIAVPHGREADDVARFLAGLPGKEGSPFQALEKDPAWLEHGAAFDAAWKIYNERRKPAMEEFQQQELAGAPFSGTTLFYPFGGPDFLTATLLFPGKPLYVFMGLEPPGTAPTLEQVQKYPLATQLPRVRKTLDSLLRNSFFQTLQMDSQARGQVTDGLLPLMLMQMSRTGYEVVGWRGVGVDAEGYLTEQPAVVPGRPKPLRGFAVEFKKAGSPTIQRAVYFSADVSDAKLAQNKPMLAYMQRLKPMTAFFKSASYLPHYSTFSIIRNFVLENALAVVQDDTGPQYRYYKDGNWQVTLYGKFRGPIALFARRNQPDLKKAFEDDEPKPLTFGIGYLAQTRASALIVAKRKTL